MDELNRRYFDWLCRFVSDNRYAMIAQYRSLLRYLHGREFTYLIDLDGNRAADGEDLRYRFGSENGYSDSAIATYLDNKPCSILEMMIALAIRCEDHIMEDDSLGNRTGEWFWSMIESLGLKTMTDVRFTNRTADIIIDRFLNREYERDGHGGLFTVRNCRRDMRSIEIWYQMCMYLENIIEGS